MVPLAVTGVAVISDAVLEPRRIVAQQQLDTATAELQEADVEALEADDSGLFDWMRELPVVFFSYLCHANILYLYSELRRQKTVEKTSRWASKASSSASPSVARRAGTVIPRSRRVSP